MLSQFKNKVFTFAELLWLFPFLRRFAFNIFKKCIYPFCLALIGVFLAENKMVLSFVFRFCDCHQGHWLVSWSFSMQKYGLAFLNRSEQVHSPQSNENSSKFWREIIPEKRKKEKTVRRQMKIEPGYLSSPAQNLLTLQNFVKTTDGLQIDWVFVVWVVLVVFKPCKALAGEVKGWMSMNGFERMKRLFARPTVSG